MRARIVLLVGASTSLVLVAFLVPLALLVRASTADRALGAAVVRAQALAPLVALGSGEGLTQAIAQANRASSEPVTVFLPDGQRIGAPAPLSDAVVAGRTGRSVTASAPGGREVIVAVAGLPDGTAVIRTFVPDQELRAGVSQAWLVLALLGLGLLVVSLLVADTLARLLTRPLVGVADVAVRLADGFLGARTRDEGPAEVRQVSTALNRLARRITELMAQERATAADLSHRLRTPLTVLRIDLDAVDDLVTRQRLEADLDSVDRALDEVIRDTQRPSRVAGRLPADAAEVVRERVRFWSVVAHAEGRPASLAINPTDGPIPVGLAADELAACVDALIGNVFAHTEPGVGFGVALTARADGGALLLITDHGRGMPEGWVQRRGRSAGGSTGLGLDIVARAAQGSGGSIHIGQGPGGTGTRVSVTLGPPPPVIIASHRQGQSSRRRGSPEET